MEPITSQLPPALQEMAAKHFVLLASRNRARRRDSIQLNVSGYSDVMYLMADLVKVCLLALEAGDYGGTAHIPEPAVNISGVLGIVLNLIPYEEAALLDKIREGIMEGEGEEGS